MTIFYVHGLGSGKDSRTGNLMKTIFPDDDIICPEMPVSPVKAREYLLDMCAEYDPQVVIGTSLGGFYSMFIGGRRKIIVNPAIDADSIIMDKIGYGTHEFFCKRADGLTEFTIDEKMIAELRQLKEELFSVYENDSSGEYRNPTYAIFGNRDELCNCRESFRRLCGTEHCIIADELEHRLQENDIRKNIAPLVESFRES